MVMMALSQFLHMIASALSGDMRIRYGHTSVGRDCYSKDSPQSITERFLRSWYQRVGPSRTPRHLVMAQVHSKRAYGVCGQGVLDARSVGEDMGSRKKSPAKTRLWMFDVSSW